MLVAVMACHREKPDAADTLASMRLADDGYEAVTVVDSTRPLQLPGEVQLLLSADDAATQEGRTPRARAMLTYARCLEAGADVVVEDDLLFAPGWYGHLVQAVKDVRGVSLLGYNRFGREGWHPAGEKLWGSLLMYHPPELRGELARALRARAATSPTYGADEVIGETLGWQVWCLSPSLVQHVGLRSVINPDHGRREAPDFQ